MVNPKLRMFLRHYRRYLFHGIERGLFAAIVAGDVAMREAGLEVCNIAAEDHRSIRAISVRDQAVLPQHHRSPYPTGTSLGCGE